MNSLHTPTHPLFAGYIFWIFGIFGTHRFFFGKKISGIIYSLTWGLFFVGWIIDLFLMPQMARDANRLYLPGEKDYTIAWLLLIFTGFLGLHRFYLGKWGTGLLYFLTLGLFGIGWVYDMLTLNEQITMVHRSSDSFHEPFFTR